MVQFKSWRDAYLFMKEYGNFSCLNCEYGHSNLDLNEEHTESEYVHCFCSNSVSMVRLDLMFVCRNWKHHQTGETLEGNMDCDTWNISNDVAEVLDVDRKWTFEEIEEVIKNHEEFEE